MVEKATRSVSVVAAVSAVCMFVAFVSAVLMMASFASTIAGCPLAKRFDAMFGVQRFVTHVSLDMI
jgi:hypothetical protein